MKFNGKIKRWIDDRGFGFIKRDDGQGDVFVHHSETDGRTLKSDDAVEFEIGEGRDGKLCAKRCRRVDAPVAFGGQY